MSTSIEFPQHRIVNLEQAIASTGERGKLRLKCERAKEHLDAIAGASNFLPIGKVLDILAYLEGAFEDLHATHIPVCDYLPDTWTEPARDDRDPPKPTPKAMTAAPPQPEPPPPPRYA